MRNAPVRTDADGPGRCPPDKSYRPTRISGVSFLPVHVGPAALLLSALLLRVRLLLHVYQAGSSEMRFPGHPTP